MKNYPMPFVCEVTLHFFRKHYCYHEDFLWQKCSQCYLDGTLTAAGADVLTQVCAGTKQDTEMQK